MPVFPSRSLAFPGPNVCRSDFTIRAIARRGYDIASPQIGDTGAFPFVPESGVCMCWIWLFLAIFLEVAATILMKLSDGLTYGLTRSLPTIGMFVLYGLSFIPMTIALKEMEIGAVYAIWSAVGTALVAVLGVILFHEPASTLKAVAIGLIIAGVVCLDLSARPASRPAARAQTELSSELRLNQPSFANKGSVAAPRVASGSVRAATGP